MKMFLYSVFAGLLASAVLAADPPSDQKPAQSQNGTQATNTVCPVSGDKVGSIGKPVYVEYQGKKIALCCKDCVKDFRREPAKYAALAEKNQVAEGASMKGQ
jgi:YHS domain-containing protein